MWWWLIALLVLGCCNSPAYAQDEPTPTPALSICMPGYVCVRATPTCRPGCNCFTFLGSRQERCPTKTRTKTRTWTPRHTRTPTTPRTPTHTRAPATPTNSVAPTPTKVPATPTSPPPTPTNTAPPAPTRTAIPPTPTSVQASPTPTGQTGGGGSTFCPPGKREYYGECRAYKVLAQPDYHQSIRGRIDGSTFYHATGVAIDESVTPARVLVCDTGNNRCKLYDALGTCSGSSKLCNVNQDCGGMVVCEWGREPDHILGQPEAENAAACNFDDNLGRYGPAYRSSLCLMQTPDGTNRAEQWWGMAPAFGPDGHAYVPDRFNHRVVEYDREGVAVWRYGQPDWSSNKPGSGPSQLNLYGWPTVVFGAVVVDAQNRVYIADSANGRVVRYPQGSGQPDRIFNDLNRPYGLALRPDGRELYVLDMTGPELGQAKVRVYLMAGGDFTPGQKATRQFFPRSHTAPDYFPSYSAISWAGLTQGPFAGADLMLTEFWPGRRLAFTDRDGVYLGVIGSPSPDERGGAHWCDQHGWCPACDYRYRLHSPSGTGVVDRHGNVLIADEELNRLQRYDATAYVPDQTGCIPPPTEEVGTGPLSAPGRIAGEPTGIVIDGDRDTIITRDGRGGLMAWENYRADVPRVVYAQQARAESRGFFAIKDGLLWGSGFSYQLAVWKLPLRDDSRPERDMIRLVWDDTGAPLNYWTTGVDWHPEHGMYLAAGAQVYRIKDPENVLTGVLRVDRVLGQDQRDVTVCNRGRSTPDRYGLCQTVHMTFDPLGNLWIGDGNFECHFNMRVVVYGSSELKSATGMWPGIAQKWIINRDFTQDFGTSSWRCGPAKDRPWSPVTLEPYLGTQMLIANDGYGYTNETRAWRQWFQYATPLSNAKPQNVIEIPTGAPGGAACDKYGGCAFQDHTWGGRIFYLSNLSEWYSAANP